MSKRIMSLMLDHGTVCSHCTRQRAQTQPVQQCAHVHMLVMATKLRLVFTPGATAEDRLQRNTSGHNHLLGLPLIAR
jgi:hypothetical protein